MPRGAGSLRELGKGSLTRGRLEPTSRSRGHAAETQKTRDVVEARLERWGATARALAWMLQQDQLVPLEERGLASLAWAGAPGRSPVQREVPTADEQ